jgi:UDP-N-acetylmuramate: L-alanyl-gamma-D-glutamyl-meso-diaminopimelate ligase
LGANYPKMKVYFLGICGTAMGNAALLLRAAGDRVLGADSGVYPPMSTVLREAGIEVHEGYNAERLEALRPDVVVVGNAMSRGNPEVEWLLESRAIPFVSLPEILAQRVLDGRRNLVVCGTHGKTTTTSIAAFLLRENGRDPGFLIGGVPQDPPTGNHLGKVTDPFVIEGDEYDSAFFDKRSKFIHYQPRVAVLNNLEFDHADIFRDLADVKRAFRHLAAIVPRSGFLAINGDDANLEEFAKVAWTRVVRVGLGMDNDVRIARFRESGAGSAFDLLWKGEPWGAVEWRLPGLFNARNAAMGATGAALVAAAADGGDELSPTWLKLGSLARFRGVRRRQEIRKAAQGLTVIEDFGHHPTALAETLKSFRGRFPGARLTAVFEPRSNTARMKAMQEDFLGALANADEVYLGPVNRPEKLRADERLDTFAVAEALPRAKAFASNAALLEALKADTLPPSGAARVVTFFSNGSFDGIIEAYCAAVR